jgi:catechol 2,3-dioxygenase-like lactoylglutathione lyase family enzyme
MRMLANRDAIATVAVKDLDAAAKFYEGTLGLTRVHAEGREAVTYKTGASSLLIYRSQFAGSNKGTAVTWTLGKDVDDVARSLRAKGVPFERYEMPNATHEDDVHVMGPMRVAWFKDPDGNIHALVGG